MNQIKSQDKKIHILLNEKVHQLLRVKCALEDVTMQKYVQKLISDSVQDIKVPDYKKKT